jgi:hypothetical protein
MRIRSEMPGPGSPGVCKCQLEQPVPGGGWGWVDVPCSDFPDEDPRRNPGPLCRTFLNDCDP